MRLLTACFFTFCSLVSYAQDSEQIGEVSTEFKLLGAEP